MFQWPCQSSLSLDRGPLLEDCRSRWPGEREGIGEMGSVRSRLGVVGEEVYDAHRFYSACVPSGAASVSDALLVDERRRLNQALDQSRSLNEDCSQTTLQMPFDVCANRIEERYHKHKREESVDQ